MSGYLLPRDRQLPSHVVSRQTLDVRSPHPAREGKLGDALLPIFWESEARHPNVRANVKLFHCVVVMGAAIGCGGAVESATGTPSAGSDDAGARGPDATVAEPETGRDACDPNMGQGIAIPPGCFYRGECRGSPSAALGPADCEKPQQLDCTGPGGCQCNPTSPLVPTDCARTEQFTCADWTQPCGCRCDVNAPSPDGGTCQVFCHSYDPPVGCWCSVPIL
jgi:hypothetical protein